MSAQERLHRVMTKLPGVVCSPSMFADRPAYWVNGKEIAHFESPDALDIRLTRVEIRARRPQLVEAGCVQLRASTSDWLTVDVSSRAGAELARELAGRSAALHAAPPGQAATEPPTGSTLASRRRFS